MLIRKFRIAVRLNEKNYKKQGNNFLLHAINSYEQSQENRNQRVYKTDSIPDQGEEVYGGGV